MDLGGTLLSTDLPIDFDIGIPGLGLTVRPPSAVNVTLAWTFDLTFGLSRTDGFYFVTSDTEEFDLDLLVSIPGFNAEGRLGFLQLDVTDDVGSPSNFNLSFSVDVKDPIGTNNRISTSEITQIFSNLASYNLSQILGAKATGTAHVNLDINVNFGSASFPSLLADFMLDWNFLNASTDAGALDFGGAPQVAFKNIRLDVGSYFDKMIRPILDTVCDVLEPIRPIIDIFTTRLPVLSDIAPARALVDTNGDGSVTLLELCAEIQQPVRGVHRGGGICGAALRSNRRHRLRQRLHPIG